MMRTRLLWTLLCLGAAVHTHAQITAAEYFVDTDPGVGNGTSIALTSGPGDLVATELSTPLSVGFHTIGLRFKDANGVWGIAESRPVYVFAEVPNDPADPLMAAEYFIDDDPGLGNGTAATLVPGPGDVASIMLSLDASLWTPGFHTLSVRFKDDDGKWGIAESRPVYVFAEVPIAPAGPLTAAEYFIDDDPGVGNGVTATLVPGPGDVASIMLSLDASLWMPGFHTLSVRFKDDTGKWGIAESRPVYVFAEVPIAPAGPLTAAEYFIDDDPGVGNGVAATLVPGPGDVASIMLSLDASLWTPGFHTLSVRFKDDDGKWGIAESRPVYVFAEVPIAPAGPLTAAEYFIDDDPGVGNGVAATLVSGPGDVASIMLALDASLWTTGFHTLSVRFKDDAGKWGIAESRPVYVYAEPVTDPAGPITAAEYFIDTDPGVGNGTAITLSPGDVVNISFLADASSLALGTHILSVRYKHADGKWGIAESRSFVVELHDECVDAIVIPVRAQEDCPAMATTGTTAGATSSSTISCNGQNHADVWFTFNAGSATSVQVALGEIGAEDLGLQVLDACGGTVVYCADGPLHTFATTPSTDYWLQVYSITSDGAFSICVSEVTEVIYYSQTSGAVTDPIWDVVASGSPGVASFTPTATMVVQLGHSVTNNGTVDVNDLVVNGGGVLNLADGSTLSAYGEQVLLNGSVNAIAGSELALAGPEATISGLVPQTLWHLTVNTTAGTTLNALLGVQGTLQLGAGASFDAGTDRLTLVSGPEGTGRLGAVPGDATFTGDLTMQRFIPGGATNWRLLGSAVGGSVEDWDNDFITAGFPGSDFPSFDAPVGSGILWPSVRAQEETTMQGSSLGQTVAGVASSAAALSAGKGFAVWCGDDLNETDPFIVDVTGAPVIAQSPLGLPVSYTDRGAPALDGWNLVSNPLPSPIAFSAIARNAVDNGYYVYDPATGNMAHWDGTTSTSTPLDVLNGTIASSQAFWLKASAASPTATVDESAKVDEDEGGVFGGDGLATLPMVRLGIQGVNAFSDQAVVYFGLGTPAQESADVLKVDFAHQQAASIATLASGGELLMVNKYGAIESAIAIPVAVRAKVQGVYTIELHVANTPLSCLWLEDLQTGTLTPVSDGAQYSFTQAPSEELQARFVLHATAPLAFAAEDGSCGPTSGSATVDVGAGPADVTWSTAAGTVLLEQPGAMGMATVDELPSGAYTVHVSAPGMVCGELVHDFSISTEGEAVEALITAPGTALVDEQVTFTGTVTEGATYHWDFGDGTTSTEAAPTHVYAAPGTYTVTLTATVAECSTTTSTTVVVTFSTGITGTDAITTRVWYVTDGFVVEHGYQGLLGIEVLDATGRVVYTQQSSASPGRTLVPARGLASGVWFVRLTHAGAQESFRVPVVR